MRVADKFIEVVKKRNLFTSKDKLLLAVSGGVDSVVLCELCHLAGFDYTIAHCNFQLRGEESHRDEMFVRGIGEKYKVDVKVRKFETEKFAQENKLSIQEAARKLRYEWFDEIVKSELSKQKNSSNADAIHHSPFTIHLLTAHHADDNNETLLMNFFRGTGLHGLTGIPEKSGYIRRPLLSFTKEDLLAFAKENHLSYVEDSSNQSSKYTRNFFRNELLPAIVKVYPQVNENLQNNISRFKEIENLYQLTVGEFKKKLCKEKGNEVHIPVKQLMGYNNRALIYEIISPYGFTEKQVDEVIKLSISETGSYIISPEKTFNIIRHRHWFIISPVSGEISENVVIEEGDKEVIIPLGKIEIKVTSNQQPATSNQTASLDLRDITFPLLLRKWKTGDYFYPLGMKKKKKVARFLIDLKLSKTDKEKVWVLESNKRIIWVVGYRIDERFKLTDKTLKNLNVTLVS